MPFAAKGMGDEKRSALIDALIFEALLVAVVGIEAGGDFGNYRVLPARVSAAFDPAATADKARRNIVGSSFPRFSARRRIPAQAFALK